MADNRQRTQVSPVGLSDEQLREALKDIFLHFGYDLSAMPAESIVAAKTDLAERLSDVARHDPPWGWRYVHNFMTGGVVAGRDFKAAILGLAAMVDGMPVEIVQGRTVQVTALGNLRPGTLVFGDSHKCDYPPCPVYFLPKNSRHRFHSKLCQRLEKKRVQQS